MHEAAWLTDACRHIHRTTSFLPAKRPRSAGRQTRSDTKPPSQRLAKGSWALSPPPPLDFRPALKIQLGGASSPSVGGAGPATAGSGLVRGDAPPGEPEPH